MEYKEGTEEKGDKQQPWWPWFIGGIASLGLIILIAAGCGGKSLEDMSLEERREEVQKLRVEYGALPEWRLDEDSTLTRSRQTLRHQLGLIIPIEDIAYDKISCPEALFIQRAQIAYMRQADEDVTDALIESNERYAKAERVTVECRNKAPTPTPASVQIQISARDLADDYAANEVAADSKYKSKHARITGVVEAVGAGQELRLGDGTSWTILAYALIHPEIPCFVDDPDSLASLTQNQLVTVEGIVLGYRTLEVEGFATKIIVIGSCSIVEG